MSDDDDAADLLSSLRGCNLPQEVSSAVAMASNSAEAALPMAPAPRVVAQPVRRQREQVNDGGPQAATPTTATTTTPSPASSVATTIATTIPAPQPSNNSNSNMSQAKNLLHFASRDLTAAATANSSSAAITQIQQKQSQQEQQQQQQRPSPPVSKILTATKLASPASSNAVMGTSLSSSSTVVTPSTPTVALVAGKPSFASATRQATATPATAAANSLVRPKTPTTAGSLRSVSGQQVMIVDGKVVRVPPPQTTSSSQQQQQQKQPSQQSDPLRTALVALFKEELQILWETQTTVATTSSLLSLQSLADSTIDAILVKYNSNPSSSSQCADQLLSVLKDTRSGPPLRARLKSRALTAEQMVNSRLQDLLSEEQQREQEKEREDHLLSRDQSYMLKLKATPTPFFKCGKCQSRECVWEQKQTSRGDEGSTCFVTCTECRHSWKCRQ